MGQFFAQNALFYQIFNIKKRSQVCILEDTCFAPGRDLEGTRRHRVITTAGNRAAYSHPHFKYSHRITLPSIVFANGLSVAPLLFSAESVNHASPTKLRVKWF